jgi:fructose-bisphosphate aldolase class II
MKTLRECLQEAREKQTAIGHFNVSNLEVVWSIFRAARELNQPVIIGVSEGERKFMGVRQIAAIVRSLREEYNYPIFLNADHTHFFEDVQKAIEAGFDSAMIDGSQLSFEANVSLTKQVVEFARSFSKRNNKDVLIEAELGFLGASSKLLEEIPVDVDRQTTSMLDAKSFVEQTDVDLLAPSIGNIHGMVKEGNPHIDVDLVGEIAKNVPAQIVLHGGSGIALDEVRAGIKNGISAVHINTEIRVAFRHGLEKSLKENDSIAPYKYLKLPQEMVYQSVLEKIKLLAGMNNY